MTTDIPIIEDENDFIYAIYKRWKDSNPNIFPKVSNIPKGKSIIPDIDLLEIKEVWLYGSYQTLTIGYEFKVLKMSDPYAPFYSGLGQALTYFNWGINRAYLMLGIYGIPSTDPQVKEIRSTLEKICSFFKEVMYLPQYFGVRLYVNDITSYDEILRMDDKAYLSTNKDDFTFRTDNILHRTFSYEKNFERKMERKRRSSASE